MKRRKPKSKNFLMITLTLVIVIGSGAFLLINRPWSGMDRYLIGRWEYVLRMSSDGVSVPIRDENRLSSQIAFFPNGIVSNGSVVRPGMPLSVHRLFPERFTVNEWSLSGDKLSINSIIFGGVTDQPIKFSNDTNTLIFTGDGGVINIFERVEVHHDPSILIGTWLGTSYDATSTFSQDGNFTSTITPGVPMTWSAFDSTVIIRDSNNTIIKEWYFEILHNDLIILTYTGPNSENPGTGYVLVRE